MKDIEGSMSEGQRIEYPIIADPQREVATKWGEAHAALRGPHRAARAALCCSAAGGERGACCAELLPSAICYALLLLLALSFSMNSSLDASCKTDQQLPVQASCARLPLLMMPCTYPHTSAGQQLHPSSLPKISVRTAY